MTENVNINGPLNIITIKGNFNNKDVVLSLIADIHETMENQNECSETFNLDLSQYLAKVFKQYSANNPDDPDVPNDPDELSYNNIDKKLHFFVETIPTNHDNNYTRRRRYADSVINLVLKSFNIKQNDRVLSFESKEFPNVISHYVDVRNVLFYNIDEYLQTFTELLMKLCVIQEINIEFINNLESSIKNIHQMILFSYENIYGESNNSNEFQKYNDFIKNINDINKLDEQNKAMIYKYLIKVLYNKIINDYKNEFVKNKINGYINNKLKTKYLNFFQYYNKLLELIEKFKKISEKNDILNEDEIEGMIYGPSFLEIKIIRDEFSEVAFKFNHLWFVDITSKIMDMFLIRKIFNYDVGDGIIYSGIEHAMFLIEFMSQNFDFEIISVSKINDITIAELNAKIKNGEKFHKFLFPLRFKQCSTNKGMYKF